MTLAIFVTQLVSHESEVYFSLCPWALSGCSQNLSEVRGGGIPVRDLAVELLTLRHQDSSNFIMKHSTALAYKLRFYHSWLRPWTSVCVCGCLLPAY